jgi:hypothetical protein
MAGKGQLVPLSALNALFGRLDRQPRAEVRQTSCGLSLLSLQYIKPNRMQFVAWLNTGLAGRVHATRDPRQTQIGDRLGYTTHKVATRWVGMGTTAHRMLLPDAWRGVSSGSQVPPTFYMLTPPRPPVRQLSVRVLNQGKQQIFIEHWLGLLYRCSAGAECPAINPNPRFFAPFTAALRVDRGTGLPVSLVTVAQPAGHDGGRIIWLRPEVVSQATFRYGGTFSISFVEG